MDSIYDVEDSQEIDPKELYGVRDGTLFLVDATTSMFKSDQQNGDPYFLECMRHIKEILKQKVIWNRQDWVGLVLFGTEKHDLDLEIKNILTLQKLQNISVNCLKTVMEIDEGKKWKYYKDTATTEYPLHDALLHAARLFIATRTTMPIKRVILFTCQDNPPNTNDNEKHRIRAQATNFSDIDLQLFVVGFGEKWNHDVFYKDLEMLSRKINVDDYKKSSVKDLMAQVKLLSRNMAKFNLRLGENVDLDVALRSLTVKTQYLPKKNMSKETNAPLSTTSYFKVAESHDEELGASPGLQNLVLETDIQKYQTYGGRNICFTTEEAKLLYGVANPGIEVICMKPISYHLLYHYEAPYFVVPSKSFRKDNELVFAGLLSKCSAKNLMIICAVAIRKRSAPKLYTMLPNIQNGGFYLYRIPFQENVRDFSEYFSDFTFDDDKKKPPINPRAVELLEEMIKKLSIDYEPKMNPKLQVQIKMVQTLALDLKKCESLPDDTLPKTDEMRERVKDLLEEYNRIFSTVEMQEDVNEFARMRSRVSNGESIEALDLEEIRQYVRNNKLKTRNFTYQSPLQERIGTDLGRKSFTRENKGKGAEFRPSSVHSVMLLYKVLHTTEEQHFR